MEVIKLDLKKAITAIKNGSVLVCPTDTVYGLVCDAFNQKAVEKIYKIKKRPKNKLIPVFIKDLAMAKKFVIINAEHERFLRKVWPGKITVVLNDKKGGTIGLRVPNSKFVLDLIKHTGPLAETSANISGQPATTRIKEVLKYFQGKKYEPDLVLDAGDLKPAKPSQVIDFTGHGPVTLRK
ncbi:MAG: L-threonylcarbamoyladenylate synthase [Candidatus Nealsonbacteria bacterium]